MQDFPEYQREKENFLTKLYHFIQNIWPSVYQTVNSLFFGLLGFIKDTITGIWRR